MAVKNILCPVDFSDCGEAAVSYAASLAKEYDAKLHLVHVCEEPFAYVDGGFSNLPVTLPADLDVYRLQLEAIAPPRDVALERKLLSGHPSQELVAYTKDQQIDLVVMGTHGRTGLTRLLMGSVAEAVVRNAACPVLTIKQPAKTMQASA